MESALYSALCIFNTFLSLTAIAFNILTIHAIRKTSSLSENLKTLLLNLAVSDLSVCLLRQPLYVARLLMEWIQNSENNPLNTIYMAHLVSMNLLFSATFFFVVALCVERFMAFYLHLRYQELVTHKRVVTVVISVWAFSVLISMIRLWISKNVMYTLIAIFISVCIIAATFCTVKNYLTVRRHINQIHALQVREHMIQPGHVENVERKRKSAITSVYVYIVFLACYLPHIFVLLVVTFASAQSFGIKFSQHYSTTLVFLNSSLNPLIYCWKMRHIRQTVMDILRKLRPVVN